MKAYIEMILLPYVHEMRKELKLAADYPALVIFDKFTGQGTDNLLKLLEDNHIYYVMVPANCTDRLQPYGRQRQQTCQKFYDSNFRSGTPVRSVSNLVKREGCLQLIYDRAL